MADFLPQTQITPGRVGCVFVLHHEGKLRPGKILPDLCTRHYHTVTVIQSGGYKYQIQKTSTVDIGYKGPIGTGSISRMSLITDGNYVHFGQTDRQNRPLKVKVPYIRVAYIRSLLYYKIKKLKYRCYFHFNIFRRNEVMMFVSISTT